MDQYVSWNLSIDELMLYRFWEIFEESNEASGKETGQLMSDIIQSRPKLLWLGTP